MEKEQEFCVTRDKCGRFSVEEVLVRGTDIKQLQKQMKEFVQSEIQKLEEKGKAVMAIEDDEANVVEIHYKGDHRLISYYEIQEYSDELASHN